MADITNRVETLLALLATPDSAPRYETWASLDALLMPYLAYAVKTKARPTTASISNTTNHSALLDAFVAASVACDAAAIHAAELLEATVRAVPPPSTWTIKYRRLSSSRLQATCIVPSTDCEALAFVWESSAIAHTPNWALRRFGFSDSDDEEHYWRPWEPTLADAEADYERVKSTHFRAGLERLDVADVDWDIVRKAIGSPGAAGSDTPTTDEESSSSSVFSATAMSEFQTKVRVLGLTAYEPESARYPVKEPLSTFGLASHINHDPDDDEDDSFAVCHGLKQPPFFHQYSTTAPTAYEAVDDDADYWARYDQDEY